MPVKVGRLLNLSKAEIEKKMYLIANDFPRKSFTNVKYTRKELTNMQITLDPEESFKKPKKKPLQLAARSRSATPSSPVTIKKASFSATSTTDITSATALEEQTKTSKTKPAPALVRVNSPTNSSKAKSTTAAAKDFLMLLRNGAKSKVSKVKYTNTCAFDTFAQSILTAMTSSKTLIKALFDFNSKSAFIQMLFQMQKFNSKEVEKLKFNLLEKMYGIEDVADANIVRMYDQLFIENPSVKLNVKCSDCKRSEVIKFKAVPIDVLKFENLTVCELEQCIQVQSPKICCSRNMTIIKVSV